MLCFQQSKALSFLRIGKERKKLTKGELFILDIEMSLIYDSLDKIRDTFPDGADGKAYERKRTIQHDVMIPICATDMA